MSDKLKQWGIDYFEGYNAEHLPFTKGSGNPDLIIVGNVIRKDNPEAVRMRELTIPFLSMPQAVAQFGIAQKHSLVVSGTHGKTTTSALAAHILSDTGFNPSFLVGGAMVGYRDSFAASSGKHFVIEGDEYDTAYFDKGPKFLHYRAKTLIITSLEFDHADIYSDIGAIEASFKKLIPKLPKDGQIIVWQGATRAVALAKEYAHCSVVTYGIEEKNSKGDMSNCDYVAKDIDYDSTGAAFSLFSVDESSKEGAIRWQCPLWGDIGVLNATAVILALRHAGVDDDSIRLGMRSFKGVQRRLEIYGRGRFAGNKNVTLADDFAHHPTAVAETLKGLRFRFKGRRLWVVFEPRSATNRRNVHQHEMAEALSGADCVIVGSHERLNEIPEAERFSPEQVVAHIKKQGKKAWALPNSEAIDLKLAAEALAGDVICIMSNGSFDGLKKRLQKRIQEE